jgi:hypothetical protein
MKTIKMKKSVGKAYVFDFACPAGHRNSYSNTDKKRTEHELAYDSEIGLKCSEISEVEMFEEVEEKVPDVVERWYFVSIFADGNTKLFSRTEREIIEEARQELLDDGVKCSEIKLLREEF